MKKLIVRVLALAMAAMLLASCGLAETIRYRDKGENVTALQTALALLGYYEKDIDGVFGAGTLKAVKAFQKDQYMTVDGLAGWATQAKLTSLTGGDLVTGEFKDTGIIDTDIINKSGFELPETGGIGTTIFYVVGGLLAVAAVVLLVTKKRMATAK